MAAQVWRRMPSALNSANLQGLGRFAEMLESVLRRGGGRGGRGCGGVVFILCLIVGETVGWTPLSETSLDYGTKRAGEASSVTVTFTPLNEDILKTDKMRLVLPGFTCGTPCANGVALNLPSDSPFAVASTWDEANTVLLVSLKSQLPANAQQTFEISSSEGLRLPRAGLRDDDLSLLLCTMAEFDTV